MVQMPGLINWKLRQMYRTYIPELWSSCKRIKSILTIYRCVSMVRPGGMVMDGWKKC